jgi:VCBS repeat-containing protein
MLSIKIGNNIQQISSYSTYNVNAGDKIEVTPLENAKYQVLIGENEKDVILKVTEENGETYEVVLANLATYLEAGDIIAQLILNLEDQTLTVNNTAELLEALDATAAGGTIGQNQRALTDAENIDPSRSAAEDSDQLRSRPGFLLEDTAGNDRPYVEDVELLDVEVINGLNVITGQFIAYDPDIGDTHTFAMVDGTISVTDDFGVITLIDDDIQVIVNEDGTFSITGDFNQLADGEIATLTFEYTATDNGGLVSNPGLVTLNIEGTNDAPIITLSQSQLLEDNVFEDTLFYLHDKADVNFDDVDARGDMMLTLSAENGVINVVLDGTSNVTVENNNSNSVTIFGTNEDLQTLFNNTGSAGSYITYMPDANSDLDDTIQIVLNDQGDNAPENALSDTDNINLVVDAVVGNVTITMEDAQVFEDESVIPVLEVTYTDAADPNETRLLQFTLPEGWEIVEDGLNGWSDENGDGVYELDVSALVSEGLDNERDAEVTISVNGPQIITPPNSDVDISDLSIIAQAFESVSDEEITEENNESIEEIAGTIIVDAVVGNVEINELVLPNVYEDGTIVDAYANITLGDVSDTNETYTIQYTLPNGWVVSELNNWNIQDNGDGTQTLSLNLTQDDLVNTFGLTIEEDNRHQEFSFDVNLPYMQTPPNSDIDLTISMLAQAFESPTDLESDDTNNISSDGASVQNIVDAVVGTSAVEIINSQVYEDESVSLGLIVKYTDAGDINDTHTITFNVPEGWSVTEENGWILNTNGRYTLDVTDLVNAQADETNRDQEITLEGLFTPSITPPPNSDVDITDLSVVAQAVEFVTDNEITQANNQSSGEDFGTIIVDAVVGDVTIESVSASNILEDGTVSDGKVTVTFSDLGDENETYVIKFVLPEGWSVDTTGTDWTGPNANGVIKLELTQADLESLSGSTYDGRFDSDTFEFDLPALTPPPNSDEDVTIKVIAKAFEDVTDLEITEDNNTSKDTEKETIIVDAVSGLATIEIINTSTYEDTAVTPQLKITYTDVDDINENHWVTFKVPVGWSVTDADGWTYLGLGSWGKDISALVDSLADDNGTDNRYDTLTLTIDAPSIIPPANSDYDAQGGFLHFKEAFATAGVIDVVTDQEITLFNNTDFDSDHGTIIVDAVAGEVDLTIIDSEVLEDNSVAPILQVTYTDAGDMNETHYIGFRVPDGWSVTADNGWVYNSIFGMYIKDISSLVDQAAIDQGVVGDRDATITINVTAPSIMPPENSNIDVYDLTAIATVFDIAHDTEITFGNNQNSDFENEGYIDVIPVNDPPEFDSSDDISLVYSEDASIATINANSGILSGDFDFESLASDIDDTDEDLHISKINGQAVDAVTGWSGTVEFAYTDQNGNPAIITALLSVNQEGEYTITNISDLNPIPSGSTAVASLTFNVADDDGAETPTVKTINISITGDNDNPIITTENDALIFNIDENSVGGTILGNVDSTDIDGSTRIYSFVDSNGNSVTSNEFEINPTTGQITVKAGANLDYETQTQYILYVKADDQKGGNDIEQITININDLVENTAPTIDNATYDIVENSAVSAYVGTVSANDVDNDTLTYSLAAGILDNDKFSINSSTGVVTFIDSNGVDYETMGSDKFYKIEVDVYDGTEHTTKQFNVNILNLDENVTGGGTTIYTDSQPVVEHGTGSEHWSKTTISLPDFAGETFNFTFNMNDYGGDSQISSIKFYNSSNIEIYSDVSDFPTGTFDIVVQNVIVPDDGVINVVIDADHNASYELDGYSVVSGLIESDQVLTLEEVDTNVNDDIAGDNIDLAQLLASAEDFNPDGIPSSLDEIDLSSGVHILSHLSVDDFLAMTDDDKTLKITSTDGNDTIKLELTDTGVGSEHWYDTGTDVIDVDNGRTYSSFTNAADTSIQLLIDDSITVEDA